MAKPLIDNHNLYVMCKPAGPACNMACEYCYYLEKKDLFRDEGKQPYMSDAMLERYIKQYLEAQASADVQFTWHGGEALLRPISFYKKALELQQKYANGRHISNAIQTNGILLNAEWCRFLKQNDFLVGISIDGPAEFHDEYRRNRGGKPSHMQVMRAIRLMQQHGVEWNAMAVVNDYNADYPKEFYKFFKDIGCQYLQFTPVVERLRKDSHLATAVDAQAQLTDFSVTPEQWGDFLIAIFDEWVRHDVGKVFVQLFDATLANYVGVTPGLCSMAPTCGHAGVLEHNGDLYSCDHFVFPEYKLGNITQDTILNMMTSERQQAFGEAKRSSLPRQCRECRFLNLCNGECPKNRFATTADGEPSLNYLCAGYRKFFAHSAPYFKFMAAELAADRAPANVMSLFPPVQ